MSHLILLSCASPIGKKLLTGFMDMYLLGRSYGSKSFGDDVIIACVSVLTYTIILFITFT